MIRRQFIQLATLAGASGLKAHGVAKFGETKTIVFRVKGFSCVTCAIGLDTMLIRHDGILLSKSTYPEGAVTVKFSPSLLSEEAIRGLISDIGFSVEN